MVKPTENKEFEGIYARLDVTIEVK